jgi:hypothetical protein
MRRGLTSSYVLVGSWVVERGRSGRERERQQKNGSAASSNLIATAEVTAEARVAEEQRRVPPLAVPFWNTGLRVNIADEKVTSGKSIPRLAILGVRFPFRCRCQSVHNLPYFLLLGDGDEGGQISIGQAPKRLLRFVAVRWSGGEGDATDGRSLSATTRSRRGVKRANRE